MGGALLWFMLIAILPWGGGTYLAGLAFWRRWNAGEAMMQDASLAQWGRMVRLYKACPQDSTTELCEAAEAERTIQSGREDAKRLHSGRCHHRPARSLAIAIHAATILSERFANPRTYVLCHGARRVGGIGAIAAASAVSGAAESEAERRWLGGSLFGEKGKGPCSLFNASVAMTPIRDAN